MEKKIIEYRILRTNDTPHELEQLVIAHLNEGWQPLGGICAASVSDYEGDVLNWYYQAMVKYKTITADIPYP